MHSDSLWKFIICNTLCIEMINIVLHCGPCANHCCIAQHSGYVLPVPFVHVLSRSPIARLIGGWEGRMEIRMKNQAAGELVSGEMIIRGNRR